MSGLESLRRGRWLRCMSYFYKPIKTQKPLYLFTLITLKLNSLRHPNTYSVMRCRNEYFRNFFHTLCSEKMEQIEHWNSQFNLLPTIQEIAISLLVFIAFKPTCSSQFFIHHHVGVRLLVRLRLGFSHLREHKFRHNFHDAPTISQVNETALANVLLYGDSKKSSSENSKILQSIIKYKFATKRFDVSLF